MPRKSQSCRKGWAILAQARHDLGLEFLGPLALAAADLEAAREGAASVRLRLAGISWRVPLGPHDRVCDAVAVLWRALLSEAGRRPRGAVGRLLARGEQVQIRLDLLNGTGECVRSRTVRSYHVGK